MADVGITIDLGCGNNKHPGAVGVDTVKLDAVDIVHDLRDFPYPFQSETVQRVILSHVLEHFTIEQIRDILKEVARILMPRGEVLISVPHAFSIAAFSDPTHKSFFTYGSFRFFDRNHAKTYYTGFTDTWRITRLWTSVNLGDDSYGKASSFQQAIANACSRIMSFTVRRSRSLTLPDLIVKMLPFWLVSIHCLLVKDSSS
jgi:SAM-dependent methyltransferase